MLYLKSWLEDYIDISKIDNQALADIISLKSGEVESFTEIKDWFDGKVLIGKILEVKPHPNADRLNVLMIDLGNHGQVQILSAAPNCKANSFVPVATVGCILPWFKVTPRIMRGLKSDGLCLGKSELMLEAKPSHGLWELNSELQNQNPATFLGKSITEVLPDYFPSQTVFEIKYLQDKVGSLGCHLGLSLELANILDDISLLKPKAQRILNPNHLYQEFQKKALGLNKPYSAQSNFKDELNYTRSFFLLDLKLKENYYLPARYLQRMFFTGKNIIGGLADLSNYLLWDVGNPSHFFVNRDQTYSWNWEVCPLAKEEQFFGLGKLSKTTLSKGIVVIKDLEKTVWIPGISGSSESKVETSDKEITIEIANFQKTEVAKNSFKLNYRTDSCRFWNSGVNPKTIIVWLLHFLESLEEIDNQAEISPRLAWINPAFIPGIPQNSSFLETTKHYFYNLPKVSFEVNPEFLLKKIHAQSQVSSKEIEELNKTISRYGVLENNIVTINQIYSSIDNQYDLLFQIVKTIGLENLKEESPKHFSNSYPNRQYFFQLSKLLDLFTSFGFSQVITRPLVKESLTLNKLLPEENENFHIPMVAISTQRKDENCFRTSLLPQLLELTSLNLASKVKPLKLFEIDKLYSYKDSELFEKTQITALALGESPYLMTSLAWKLLFKSGNCYPSIEKIQNSLGSGYSYSIEGQNFIEILEITNKLKKSFHIPTQKQLWYLNVNLSSLESVYINPNNYYKDQSLYPELTKSLSLLIENKILFASVIRIFNKHQSSEFNFEIQPTERFIKDEKFDVLNFQLIIEPLAQRITHAEIDNWIDFVLKEINAELGLVKLRQN